MKAGRGSGADREGFGEASLGEGQSSNPPSDPEMIEDEADLEDVETADELEDLGDLEELLHSEETDPDLLSGDQDEPR
jgi:hypothetical protein